jgi:predicted transposase YbfD/YdcC
MVVAARFSLSSAPAPAPAGGAPRRSPLITPVQDLGPVPPVPRAVTLPALYSYLQKVPDPRHRRGCRHPLPALLALVCLAWLSGIHGYLPAADWAAALPEAERRALGFTRSQSPAASTLFEVLQALSWEALETELRAWLVAVQEALGPEASAPSPASTPSRPGRKRKAPAGDPAALALDGKALRGSWRRGAEVAGLLAVVTHRLALTVAHAPMPTKEGELTAVRPLLKALILEGLVVTVDAQFTQPDLAETICARGGDYVMRVKGNQPSLLASVQALLTPAHWEPGRRDSTTTHEVGHGRVETRQLVTHILTDAEAADLEWPHARQVFVVISRRHRVGKAPGRETRIYGVTSLGSAGPAGADAARLLRLYRGHWTVENRAFWVRDVVLREDASPVRIGNNVAVLASLRGAVLNLLRATQGPRLAKAIRQLNANRPAALQLLGCP